jgi:hypothetical protein
MSELDKAISAQNKRVSYEWDMFLMKYGDANYDDLPDAAKEEALNLVEVQHTRFVRAIEKCGYRQADIRVPEEAKYGYVPIKRIAL